MRFIDIPYLFINIIVKFLYFKTHYINKKIEKRKILKLNKNLQ